MEQKNAKKNFWTALLIFLIAAAAIVLCCVFIPKACQNKAKYKLDVNCTRCTINGQREAHEDYLDGDLVTLSFKANDGYSLPMDVKAASGNKQLVKDTDYTYSAASGELSFLITGDTQVSIDGYKITELKFDIKIPANTEKDIAFLYNKYKTSIDYTYPSTVDWGDGTKDSKLKHHYSQVNEEKTYSVVIKNYIYDYFRFYYDSTYSTYKEVTSLTLPTSIKTLGENAFHSCSITSITLPNSLTNIEDYAFYGCSLLKSVAIPNGVTSIGVFGLEDCTSLTSVYIPNSVTSIGDSAFHNCSSLTTIDIPNTVSTIRYATFSGCTSLTSINIPNSVVLVSASAFENCTSLSSVVFANSVTSIGQNAFYNIKADAVVDMSNVDHFISLNSNIFCIDNIGTKFEGSIKVKSMFLDSYKTADYWKNTASCFVGV